MNKATWIAKKNQLCVLIKRISDHYGGDDIEWLRDYTREVIEAYKDDLQKALDCFWDLEAQLKYMPRKDCSTWNLTESKENKKPSA